MDKGSQFKGNKTCSLKCGCTAFTRFFKHQSGFPKFKKKDISDVKMYFVKNNPKDCYCERHRINIPTLGWVRLKGKRGYLPTTKRWLADSKRSRFEESGSYYVSVLMDIPGLQVKSKEDQTEGIGIDLGLKEFAVLSNGKIYKKHQQNKPNQKA